MRIGIVGCGLIGQKRAEAAKGHDIAMVCDLNLARAEALAQKVGGRATTDWRTLVDQDLDLIVVATTHDQLAAITLGAIQAGKHVLVEKPAARSAKELAPVLAAAQEKKRLVKVGFNHRFHPALLRARELVDAGELGPLLYIRGRYGHGGRIGYEQEWRCVRAVSGGGELIDQGSHLIDLSRWFLGDLGLEYAALPTYFWKMDVEDNCFLALKGRQGQMAWLHATWTEWKNLFSFEICGRDGKLMIEGLGGSYGVERLAFYKMLPEMGPPVTTAWEYPFPDRSWQLEFQEFISAIQGGRQPVGNIHDALANLEIVEQAYASRGV